MSKWNGLFLMNFQVSVKKQRKLLIKRQSLDYNSKKSNVHSKKDTKTRKWENTRSGGRINPQKKIILEQKKICVCL